MPWATLQEFSSYLSEAEAGGEPVVLPFLYLFRDCTSLKCLNLGCEKPVGEVQTHEVCGCSWVKLMETSSDSRKAAA